MKQSNYGAPSKQAVGVWSTVRSSAAVIPMRMRNGTNDLWDLFSSQIQRFLQFWVLWLFNLCEDRILQKNLLSVTLLYRKLNLPVFEVTGNQIPFLSIHPRVKVTESILKSRTIPNGSQNNWDFLPLFWHYLFVFWPVCEILLAHSPFWVYLLPCAVPCCRCQFPMLSPVPSKPQIVSFILPTSLDHSSIHSTNINDTLLGEIVPL